jgi:hypothetical protein
MSVAEHVTDGAVERTPDAELVGDPPLQIRMNPFLAPTNGAPPIDPRLYVQRQASSIGRLNLFTPEAMDIIVDGSRNVPSQLRSIAQLAFFAAASERACQIQSRHVTNALASRIPFYHDTKNIAAMHAQPDAMSDTKREAVLESTPASGNHATGSALAMTLSGSREIIQVSRSRVENDLDIDATPALDGTRNALAVYEPALPVTSHTPSASSTMMIAVSSAENAAVRQRRWVSRSVGISSALVALFLAGGTISSSVVSGSSKNASRAVPMPAAYRPVALTKAVVQEPALTEKTVDLSVPNQSAPQEGTPIQQAGLQPAAPKEISTSVPKSIGTANRAPRKKRVAVRPVVRSQADDDAREATAAPDRLKAVDAATDTPRQIPKSGEAAQQAAALKDAEEKALTESTAQRVADEKAAAKMAVAEMLHADQVRTLEDSAREARLAADKAQAEKEAADRAKAEEAAKAEKDKGGLRFGTKGLRIF